MAEQDPKQAAALIDMISSQRMGVEPDAQTQAAARPQSQGEQGGAQPQPQTPQKSETENDPPQDAATKKGDPKTEGDKMQSDAVIYDVPFGDETRKLTPEQIASTFERYRDLNYRQSQMRPILSVIENIMKENPGMPPQEVAKQMDAIYRAQGHNPQMGSPDGRDQPGQAPEGNPQMQSPDQISDALTKWEEENAVSLPPGYKEMMAAGSQTPQMAQKLQAMEQMMRQMLAQSQGVADAAKTGMGQAQQQKIQAIQQTIGNNLDRVQQALQIPGEKADDFMVFAAERGFTLEDFTDLNLTAKVMQDFKNTMDSPEMERLRAMAQRRAAYTGGLGSTPSGGGAAAGAPAQASEQGTTFDRMADNIMKQRGLG